MRETRGFSNPAGFTKRANFDPKSGTGWYVVCETNLVDGRLDWKPQVSLCLPLKWATTPPI